MPRERQLINMGSNELVHDALPRMHRTLVDDQGPLEAYPRPEAAVHSIAASLNVDPAGLVVLPGSHVGISFLVADIAQSRHRDLFFSKYEYAAWNTSARLLRMRDCPLPSERLGLIDAAVSAGATNAPSVVALSWPNGPTGRSHTLKEVLDLIHLCRTAGTEVVVDGCYAAFDQGINSLLAAAEAGATVLISSSKMFGIAGLRSALMLTTPERAARVRGLGIEDAVSRPSLAASVQCWTDIERWESVWSDIVTARQSLLDALRQQSLTVPDSGGNFLHLQTPTAEASRRLSAGLAERGYRVKAEMAAPLMHSARFAVGNGQTFESFCLALYDVIDLERENLHAHGS